MSFWGILLVVIIVIIIGGVIYKLSSINKQDVKGQVDDEDDFPWEDVEACMKDTIAWEEVKDYVIKHGEYDANWLYCSCPKCGEQPQNLHWIHFRSPPYTWSNLMGTEGYLAICNKCKKEVSYFQTAMN